jgi:ERCC4-type nuclease
MTTEIEILCSPAEPEAIRLLTGATMDWDTEHVWGLDFMWATPYGMAGVQRKRFPSDFIASHRHDDRLAKEIKQMADRGEHLTWKYLILEMDPNLKGRIPWNPEGHLIGIYQGKGSINRKEVDNLIESLDHFHKIRTRWSTGHSDTADIVKRLAQWTGKEAHSGYIPTRQCPPKSESDKWHDDWREFIMTGFQGINYTLARAILKHDPRALMWKPGLRLEDVPKIGPLRANKLRMALEPKEER